MEARQDAEKSRQWQPHCRIGIHYSNCLYAIPAASKHDL
jgi:class 3 adenylate cyclase